MGKHYNERTGGDSSLVCSFRASAQDGEDTLEETMGRTGFCTIRKPSIYMDSQPMYAVIQHLERSGMQESAGEMCLFRLSFLLEVATRSTPLPHQEEAKCFAQRLWAFRSMVEMSLPTGKVRIAEFNGMRTRIVLVCFEVESESSRAYVMLMSARHFVVVTQNGQNTVLPHVPLRVPHPHDGCVKKVAQRPSYTLQERPDLPLFISLKSGIRPSCPLCSSIY